ncbi:MAG: hypothetical protein ACLUN5_02370 [Oscillospiraceae bacterium]
MGAMFAQTSGLPLKLGIELNSMDQYSAFFPGVTTLGDLLERAGYHNILMIGSGCDLWRAQKLFYSARQL